MKHKIIVTCMALAIALLPLESAVGIFAREPLRRQHLA